MLMGMEWYWWVAIVLLLAVTETIKFAIVKKFGMGSKDGKNEKGGSRK